MIVKELILLYHDLIQISPRGEMVDTADSKSAAFKGRAGSSPAGGTKTNKKQ